jgi:hypothetical protein
MRKVLRGYAKDKNGNLIVVGTIPVPHSKDKPAPRERQNKRHLVRQAQPYLGKNLLGGRTLIDFVVPSRLERTARIAVL